MIGKAATLVKEANAKHKGIFFYINKNKKMGKHSPKKSGMDLMNLKKTMKKASRISKARGH